MFPTSGPGRSGRTPGLDHIRIAAPWAKDLQTLTHRGNIAGIHDALVGLGSEPERRIALDGDLDGVPRLKVLIGLAQAVGEI
ncbi:hypothetical protein [Streptomyces griseosporeus]